MIAFDQSDYDLNEQQVSNLTFEQVKQYSRLTTTLHYEISTGDKVVYGIKQSVLRINSFRDHSEWLHALLDQKIKLMEEVSELKLGWSFTDKQAFTFRFA